MSISKEIRDTVRGALLLQHVKRLDRPMDKGVREDGSTFDMGRPIFTDEEIDEIILAVPPPEIKQLKELKERVWLLEEVVRELLIYASATPKDLYSPGGYTSELVPRLTRIGTVKVVERLAAIRGLVTESPKDPSKKVET